MKRKQILWAGSFVLLVNFLMTSCKKDSGSGTPTITLSDSAISVNESVGTVSATINLSEAVSQDITISYTLSGTAINNGDYQADTTSPIVIPAGSKSATIQFTVFDDAVLEADKTIEISYSSTDAVNFNNTKTIITIIDNETDLSSLGLQTDLTWDAGNLVDLDLYAVTNVVISDGEVTDFDIVSRSENEKGFESVFINNTDNDGEYYIAVSYASGSRAVDYTLAWTGPSINEVGDNSFLTTDVGYGVFYGPINKSGSTYGRLANGGSIFNLKGMKSYVYKGKLR